jgi:NAD(P)-dependent dehydrogenase (short-subunit alcohol dehydrogenase family)
MPDALGYRGARVLVVGGASGIGRAAAEIVADLGADVLVADHRPPDEPLGTYLELDLRRAESIDGLLAAISEPVDVVMLCAGVADGSPGLELVNFVGPREVLARLVSGGHLATSAAVGWISSLAGLNWDGPSTSFECLADADMAALLATTGFAGGAKWFAEHPHRVTYKFTKQAVSAYVVRNSHALLRAGVRLNATLPGPTDTPLARSQGDTWLSHARDYRTGIGVEAATPADQAWPLVFLCSQAARHVAGVGLRVDAGLTDLRLAAAYDVEGAA